MNLRLNIMLLVTILATAARAQNNIQINQYINTYKSLAMAEMQRTGVPASIILAQGIHETQAGTSDLVIASNNHFGIKCKDSWKGAVVYHDDDARAECFRSYVSAEDSYRDHSDFLAASPRYAFLFKLSPENYEGWAYGLKKAGYATNVKYSQILIKLINDYDLQRYDLIALGKLPPENNLASAPLNPSADSTDALQTTASAVAYPEGTFEINGAKVVYVSAGVSLLSISGKYDIPLARLLEFNDMHQEDVLASAQLVFLQRKRKIGASELHVVMPGETLYGICQSEGIRYESLLEYNRLRPGEEPAAGEKLNLQTAVSGKPALRNQSSAKTSIPSS